MVAAGPLTQLLLESRLRVVEEENASLKEEVERLKGELAGAKDSTRKSLEQARATQAGNLRLESRLEAVELQMQEFLAASSQILHTRDTVSLLHTEQRQLQAQQALGECKQCIVFKDSKALPTVGTAAHLQGLLSKLLGIQVTVQSAKQLGRQLAPSEEGAEQRPAAYKVMLGSGGERIEVLRRKAKALKGTSMSIGPFLTPEQMALEKRLRPIARQAKAAGKHVRWQYGGLIIDGKQYSGIGGLPTPAKRTHMQQSARSHAEATSKRALFGTVGGSFAPLLQEKDCSGGNKLQAKGGGGGGKQSLKGGGGGGKQSPKAGGGATANPAHGRGSTAAKQAKAAARGPKSLPAKPAKGASSAAAKPSGAVAAGSSKAPPSPAMPAGGASSAAAKPFGAVAAGSSKVAPSPSSSPRA
jgi:hypothetical protein